jgi:hypothetical protein
MLTEHQHGVSYDQRRMRRRIDQIGTKVLPRGWKDAFRQILLGAGAYMLYELVRAIVYGNAYSPGYKPFGDATKIIHLERLLHVFAEPSIQAWVAGRHWLMDIADWTYLNAHYFVTIGALLFIYFRRNDSFYFVRNVFMIAMGLALVGYALYPTAPPRLMPTRRRTARIAWRLYPLLITFVVVATGNHYLTDVFLGALTAGASWLIASRLLARARPDAWAFRPARAFHPATA